ncbi:MAG: phosphoribosylanthranilate isomerase [Pseudomonadota bacterium]
MIKVKICGITNLQDATMAVELGVDALGFIFAPSPRQITPQVGRGIIRAIPPFVKTVGVFVNEGITTIRHIMDFCGLDLIQLHGDESPDLCEKFMPRTLKAFRLKDESDLPGMRFYLGKVRAFLFDTFTEAGRGGTGKTFDWELALRGKGLGVPVILSGGLRPSNIEKAVSTVRPYAVDVNSGIEKAPGEKDHALMEALMEKVRRINRGDLTDA